MNNVAKFVAYLFWAIATGLYLTAMLTDYWVSWSNSLFNYGLFKECYGNAECLLVGWSFDEKIRIVIPRIVMLAGAALVVLGVLFGLIGLISKSNCPLVTEGVFYILGGIVILAACGVFTGLNFVTVGPVRNTLNSFLGTDSSFYYSFYFGWISGLLYIVAGSCSIIAGKNSY